MLEEGNMATSTSVPESGLPKGTPAVFVVVQPVKKSDHYSRTFPKKAGTILGSLQLASFGLAFLTQVVMFSLGTSLGVGFIGTGIWTSIFFGVAGSLGIIAAYKPSSCTIVAFMVMSIIASTFTVPLMVFAGIGISEANYRENSEYYSYSSALKPMFILQFIAAFVEAVAAITSAAFGCRACCCRTKETGAVMYAPQDGVSGSGYVAIPLTGLTSSGDGFSPPVATAAVPVQQHPSMLSAEAASDNPPKYEDAASNPKLPVTPEEGTKYQRFS